MNVQTSIVGGEAPVVALSFRYDCVDWFWFSLLHEFPRVIEAKTAERWDVGKRIRDVEQGPDGSLWMLEDANPGALIHVTTK